MDLNEELVVAEELARIAGSLALQLRENLTVTLKPLGQGPVTNADIAIDKYICKKLTDRFPKDGIISEESYVETTPFLNHQRIWFVDPIDGTASFISGADDFVVMIGLSIDGIARLGVVYQPISDIMWRGIFTDESCLAERFEHKKAQKITFSPQKTPRENMTILVSRNHHSLRQDILIEELKPANIVYRSSVGLKAMLILEKSADLYVAWSRHIKMWDTCAPMAIIAAAGATMCFVDGDAIKYGGEISHGKPIMIAGFVPDECLLKQLSRIANQT